MYLKKLTENREITIVYIKKGLLQTVKGRVYSLNLKEQTVSMKVEQQKVLAIQLSRIKSID